MVVNAVSKGQVELTVFLPVSIMEVVHHDFDIGPIQTVSRDHGLNEAAGTGLNGRHTLGAQMNKPGGLRSVHWPKFYYSLSSQREDLVQFIKRTAKVFFSGIERGNFPQRLDRVR